MLDTVDVSIRRGDFVGVVGPSGSGKSTLLKALLGIVPVRRGTIERDQSLRVAYVPQTESVDWNFPLSVTQLASMPLARHRLTLRLAGQDRELVTETLARLDLTTVADQQIGALSRGQQQRAFLARAIVSRPDVYVLDEPTSGVDVRTRLDVVTLLGDLRSSGATVVVATHDLNGFGARLPRLIGFNRTVIADGPPTFVLRPYFLERIFGSPMAVLDHGGIPVVVDHGIAQPMVPAEPHRGSE